MSLITTTRQLADFCARQRNTPFVTVDTEFMRERTYWPKLCLVQIGGADESVAVDPLAEGIDLSPLFALMNDANVLKVFHAARQDVEIFYNLTGRVPAPMFDTQVAAMVCGYGESASYETLASSLAVAKIDKSSRFTDWTHRPLSDKQLDYALGDVIYLRQVYLKLKASLEKRRARRMGSGRNGRFDQPANLCRQSARGVEAAQAAQRETARLRFGAGTGGVARYRGAEDQCAA